MIIMLVVFIAIFYFMILRPENKKKKEQENLRNSLHRGDKITTIGGIMGKIVDIKDEKIVIETGEDQVRLELQKWSVMTNNTAEKEKTKRAEEAKAAAQKAKEEKARAKAEKKAGLN
ncbi:MAG: preprotein translocase subunit YajC [Oscillospiraceae bacterium]|nr:preprotein translocase subunit YajC [Oscillospiraceae bacterium]